MWLEIVAGMLGLLGLLQFLLLFLLWRRMRQWQQRADALAHAAAYACTDVPTSMLVAVLGRLEQRLDQLEQQSPPPRRSYDLAQQLAREGADVEQLITRCGLSRDEARLVRQLHPATQ